MPKPPTEKKPKQAGVKIGRDAKIGHGSIVGGDQIQNIEKQEVHIHRAAQPAKKKEIPRLLPYKINRRDQEKRLKEIFQQYRSRAPLPVVTVIHGDEEQALDTFLDRLREDFIPNQLVKTGRSRSKPERVPILTLAEARSLEQFHDRITEGLVDTVLGGKGEASITNIQRRLARSNCPTVVEIFLSEDFIFNHKANALEAILAFWDQWPDLAAGQVVFVFIFFAYSRRPESKLRTFFGMDPRSQIQSHLEQFSFQKYSRTISGILPELTDVPKDETDVWARGEASRYYPDRDVLLAKIREIYQGKPVRPMMSIVSELKIFLKEG